VRIAERGAADGHHLAFGKDQPAARVGPELVAEVDGRVVRVLLEGEGLRARRQVHRDVRVQPAEIGQPRNQPLRGKGRHHGQLEHEAHLVPGADLQRVAAYLVEVAANARGIFAAHVGQREALAHAREQRNAQALLEHRHLPPDGALRERQFGRRAGEAAEPRRGLEGLQRAEVGNVFSHRRYSAGVGP
jgi:hypothetical protein